MTSRYDTTRIWINNNDQYDNLFKERKVKWIRQYLTPNLRYPTTEEIGNLTIINHVWKTGDKYWKLAAAHYDRPGLWWVIAWYNQSPTEAHLREGQVVFIPKPLELVFNYLDV